MDRRASVCEVLALVVATAALSAAAQAQTSGDGALRALEEVTVTARRIEENLQKVPVAVTALDAQNLEEQSIFKASDLEFNIPGLKISTPLQRGGAGAGRFVIRGLSTALGSNYPGVQTLIAEVPVALDGNVPFYDLQSVQVLKGPQGVAFGRNALGGALLVYPAQPTGEYTADFGVNLGRYDNREIDAAVNIPVSDKLWIRAAGNWVRRDGFTRNVITGDRLDDRHSNSWRLSATYRPIEWLENYTMVSGFELDEIDSSNHMVALNPLSPAAFVYRQAIVNELQAAQAAGPRKSRSDLIGRTMRDDRFLVNMTTADINDNLTVKNIFGWQRAASGSSGHDMDGTSLALLNLATGGKLIAQRYLSDEIQLQGTHMDGELNWIAGAFYGEDEQVDDGRQGVNDVLGGLTQAVTFPSSDTYAGFAQVSMPLDFMLDRLSLTLGVRHTWDSRKDGASRYVISRATGERIACQVPGLTVANCLQVSEGEWSGWSWAATFDYKVTDNALVYLAHRHGYKGGGFNPGTINPSERVVDPEHVNDLELGLKWDWSVGALTGRTNLAVYHQWYTDIVRTEVRVTQAGPESIIRNVAEATIRGGELETTLIYGPIELSGWLAYTDAILEESDVPLAYPVPIRFFDVPLHEGMASARLHLPIDSSYGALSLMASLFHRGPTHNDQNAVSPFSMVPAYDLVNYQLDWREVMGTALDASLYVKNATDELYSLGGSDLYNTIGVVMHLYGEPRTYGVQLRYRFGGQ
jgi:iron complex outermembrane recepter protein